MFGPWIEKAWRMQREPECLSNVAILKAALSVRTKQSEVPDYDTATVIPVRYRCSRSERQRRGGLYCVSIMFLKL
jgi:hypothetical protein